MSMFRLEDLPEQSQQELYDTLKEKFGRKRRDSSAISKEAKVQAVANVLLCLKGFSTAQQRNILKATITFIEYSQHRFWRDGNHKGNRKGSPTGDITIKKILTKEVKSGLSLGR